MSEVNTKTFYSEKAALAISPPREWKMKGRIEEINGMKTIVDEHVIQFVPMGRGGHAVKDSDGQIRQVRHFGSYTTSDPLEIQYLDWRVANVGDIFWPERYEELATPPEIQIDRLKRQLAEVNRLNDVLARQGKQPAQR